LYFRKQRNSISVSTSSTNTTINGDSGNVSQEEHDDEERYFDKIERLKRTENAVNKINLIYYFFLHIQCFVFRKPKHH